MAISQLDKPTADPPRRLQSNHRTALREFLLERVEANLFALSWLENNGVEPSRPGRFAFWGWLDARSRLVAVALDISNRLLMLDTRHRGWARGFGHFFRNEQIRFQHVVSPRRSVAPFWEVYAGQEGDFHVGARLIQHQKLYRLQPSGFTGRPRRRCGVRRGRTSEIDAIFLASVRMHREETHEDPLKRNSTSFRRHVRHRIEKGRTFVWFDDQRLVFKADISTQCSLGAQISGVYTDPSSRNQGIATRAMADICDILFEEGAPRLTLYVNRANIPARRVYEKLGFEYVTPYQTVFVAD